MSDVLEFVKGIDTLVFFFINGAHNEVADFVMYWISDEFIWVPLYVAIIFYISKRVVVKKAVLILASIALLVIATDRISTAIVKPAFKRYRPTQDPAIMASVHTVNDYRGGKYGFVSSHAANTLGLSVFLSLLFRDRWLYGLFLWSFLNGYSRIYLGVHFPLDVMFGFLLGGLMALLVYYLYRMLISKYYHE